MLREFVEKKHYLFAKEAKDWEDAIIMSCKSLEATERVESNYAHDIVECVRKYGPYIVIMPNLRCRIPRRVQSESIRQPSAS